MVDSGRTQAAYVFTVLILELGIIHLGVESGIVGQYCLCGDIFCQPVSLSVSNIVIDIFGIIAGILGLITISQQRSALNSKHRRRQRLQWSSVMPNIGSVRFYVCGYLPPIANSVVSPITSIIFLNTCLTIVCFVCFPIEISIFLQVFNPKHDSNKQRLSYKMQRDR
ncbi:unnamed protein product [Rotaria socialis]|uniref:Uncharacterized protein n=1 Tax=Rotaria socialis TaxID=392032 RepID=A0A818D1Q2_9BILA|nr:unnamed protein product [Rotaria socialis]